MPFYKIGIEFSAWVEKFIEAENEDESHEVVIARWTKGKRVSI